MLCVVRHTRSAGNQLTIKMHVHSQGEVCTATVSATGRARETDKDPKPLTVVHQHRENHTSTLELHREARNGGLGPTPPRQPATLYAGCQCVAPGPVQARVVGAAAECQLFPSQGVTLFGRAEAPPPNPARRSVSLILYVFSTDGTTPSEHTPSRRELQRWAIVQCPRLGVSDSRLPANVSTKNLVAWPPHSTSPPPYTVEWCARARCEHSSHLRR